MSHSGIVIFPLFACDPLCGKPITAWYIGWTINKRRAICTLMLIFWHDFIITYNYTSCNWYLFPFLSPNLQPISSVCRCVIIRLTFLLLFFATGKTNFLASRRHNADMYTQKTLRYWHVIWVSVSTVQYSLVSDASMLPYLNAHRYDSISSFMSKSLNIEVNYQMWH